ncbi:MAG: UDP-N-acetylmuramoyl-tripeptide--D-alanyl-D-alanine ligase [candidate division NC10 bacterium]|nr:UDP-N-acetylmuramoyl-tripeptide--D-alanyl-D-alanine ligase [candidate division NC10 bacterium]
MRLVGQRPLHTFLLKAVGLLLPYALVVVARHLDCLYILQLERYKPDRYADWLRRQRWAVRSREEIALQLLTVAWAAVFAGMWSLWLPQVWFWLLTGYITLARYRSLQVSQRLQYTPRAVRVLAVGFGIGGCLAAGGLALAALLPSQVALAARLVLGGIGGLALAGLLAPWSLRLAASALNPVERSIAQRFLAEADRRMRAYPGRVIGITGSYGKTTTKFIVADLLGSRYRVLKTPAGVNTTMGITRVIREELCDEHEYFVVEVSAYGPGEIREVCDIIHPCLGILTAVGVQHLERFGTEAAIAEAKYELLAALPAGGTAVVNADDPICLMLAARARTDGKRVVLYGMGEAGEDLAVRGVEMKASGRGTRFRVMTRGGETESFETRLLGRWNLSNILAAMAAALEAGVPLRAMREAVAVLAPAPNRLEVREEGGIVKILDVANANPRGAQMALEVLSGFEGGSRILITPGMVELGPLEAEENRRFGQAAASVCDYVVLVGQEQTRPIRDGLTERGFPADRIHIARHADEVADRLAGIVRPGDTLLFENRLPDTYLEVRS